MPVITWNLDSDTRTMAAFIPAPTNAPSFREDVLRTVLPTLSRMRELAEDIPENHPARLRIEAGEYETSIAVTILGHGDVTLSIDTIPIPETQTDGDIDERIRRARDAEDWGEHAALSVLRDTRRRHAEDTLHLLPEPGNIADGDARRHLLSLLEDLLKTAEIIEKEVESRRWDRRSHDHLSYASPFSSRPSYKEDDPVESARKALDRVRKSRPGRIMALFVGRTAWEKDLEAAEAKLQVVELAEREKRERDEIEYRVRNFDIVLDRMCEHSIIELRQLAGRIADALGSDDRIEHASASSLESVIEDLDIRTRPVSSTPKRIESRSAIPMQANQRNDDHDLIATALILSGFYVVEPERSHTPTASNGYSSSDHDSSPSDSSIGSSFDGGGSSFDSGGF